MDSNRDFTKKNFPSEYNSWNSMNGRCYSNKNPSYHLYGEKGITVCDRWRKSFKNFLEDMGAKPNATYSLDRFPNKNGNYEPSNCKWSTPKEQSNNKNNNNLIEINGETLNITQWSEKTKLNRNVLASRIRQGWKGSKIISKVASKLTKSQKIEIIKLRKNKIKLKIISEKFNVSIQAISKICKNED